MKLYVGNLSKEVSKAELNRLADPYGKLVTLKVAVDPASGNPKGFGFVEYSNADEGRAAIAGLDGRDVRGQALIVVEARQPKRIPSRTER
ncbi:MAG TPA: RNA-binding protein [Candidatus Limnocylindrales bacterium]|nr:RNA-binding protein [Candidatus Limnocylindrales bacterium]